MYATTITGAANSCGHAETYVRILDGPEEPIAMAETVLARPNYEQRFCASVTGDYSFTHSESLPAAVEIARSGWPEGTERMISLMSQINIADLAGHSLLPEPFYSEAGEEADVARYLSGEPESMIDYTFPAAPTGRIVELIVNYGQTADISKEQIMRRGAAIGAVAQRLQTDGYSVGITMASSITTFAACAEYYMPLLKAGGHLDIDALSFALAHPSFFRRMMLSVYENEPARIREQMGFYSYNNYGNAATLAHIPEAPHPQVVIENYEAMEGGAGAAQGVLDRIMKQVLPATT